jgi:hypothetical protein
LQAAPPFIRNIHAAPVKLILHPAQISYRSSRAVGYLVSFDELKTEIGAANPAIVPVGEKEK